MKKLILAATLGLLSFSSFAIDCSKSLDTIVSLSGSIGQVKAYTERNNADIQINKAYLKLLDENTSVNEIGGKTRAEIEQRITESTRANEDLKDESAQESLLAMTKLVKESCF
ncbi:MAG: hypothetical protein Q7U04_12530 [Bacteriovorax sp.]|nr:hypothetical protein [Bacteriovorax sp.]